MNASSPHQSVLFTILGGTTIPDCAAIVRAECREGSRVEMRRRKDAPAADPCTLDVWLESRSILGLVKAWKRIGHVPPDAAAELLARSEDDASIVAGHGIVKSVYAPADRDEAVVTVEIRQLVAGAGSA